MCTRVKHYSSCLAFEFNIQNITLNDIIAKTKFVGDQREVVLRTIRVLSPTFDPDYPPPNILYNNVLLHQLNQHLLPLTERFDPNVSI